MKRNGNRRRREKIDVRMAHRHEIQSQLMIALSDQEKVALVIDRSTLLTIINLFRLTKQPGPVEDLCSLYRVTFGEEP